MKFMNKAFITLIIANVGTILVSISAQASGMAFDGAGNLFFGTGNGSIFKLTPDGKKSIFASGLEPEQLAFDRSGNLFVSDRATPRSLNSHPTERRAPSPSGSSIRLT